MVQLKKLQNLDVVDSLAFVWLHDHCQPFLFFLKSLTPKKASGMLESHV